MKVYFFNKSELRKRQRETIENCPSEIEAYYNDVSYIKDTDIYKKHRFTFKHKIISIIKKNIPLINFKKINFKKDVFDIVYLWGAFPLSFKKEFVVELDNPYVLTFYNPYFFRFLRPILKKMLLSKQCKRIVCISESCKRNLHNELGSEVSEKSIVVYPFMKDQNCIKIKRGKKFLFISTQFELKGGRDVLKAFEYVMKEDSEVELTIISNVAQSVIDSYAHFTNLVFLKADIDKHILHNDIYPKHDIFVLPTYQDSFGLVFLEALSHGMPIIATDNYAIKEMVHNGKNGHLLTPPVLYYMENDMPNMELWGQDVESYIKSLIVDKQYIDELVSAIFKTLKNRDIYSEYSYKLFSTTFSENIRQEKFLETMFF